MGQELRFELLAGADVDGPDRVLEPGFLEHDVDLVPVGRGPSMDFDHRELPLVCRDVSEKLARPAGVEPTTPSLEGWCSIQFELRARAKAHCGRLSGGQKLWSGWRDLNSRHLAPKASALPGCATPRGCRILRLRPWHGQRRRTGKFPVKSDLPALLISGIKLPSFHCFTRRLRFGAAPQILPALPAEKG